MNRLLLLASFVLAGAACVDPPPAPNGELLCLSDDECPAGLTCNLDRHLCVGENDDVTAPTITRIAFDPPIANSGVARLVIEADEPLVEEAPQVTLVQGALTFALEPSETPARRVLLVDVTEVAEGTYTVGTVTVRDVAGNATSAPVSASLVVDRTPPQVLNARLVDPPERNTYADVAGRDVLTVELLPSEAIDLTAARLRVGPYEGAAACVAADVGGRVTCAVSIGSDDVDSSGPQIVEVEARDIAGNIGIGNAGEAVVDTAGPRVVLVQRTIRTGIFVTDDVTAAASPASLVTVDVFADEELDGASFAFEDAALTRGPFGRQTFAGARATGELRIGDQAPGEARILVTLTDQFGHTALEEELPGLLIDEAGPLLCVDPEHITCIDLDNDGHFATASCIGGDDVNDLDPLVYPGAQEIPGDGIDNDGLGGDTPIDDDAGVFVDSENGDDANACTSAAPCRTFDAARLRARAESLPFVFLAGRATPYVVPDTSLPGDSEGDVVGNVGIVGGLLPEPSTGAWQRTGGRSFLSGGQGGQIVAKATLLDHVELGSILLLRRATVSRSTIGVLAFSARAESVVVDSNITEEIVVVTFASDGSAPTVLRMQGSTAGKLAVGGVAHVDRSVIRGTITLMSTGARLLMTNSVVSTSGTAAVVVLGTAREVSIEILHSTVLTDIAPAVVADDLRLFDRNIVLVNNIFSRTVPGEVLRIDVGARLFVRGNAFVPGSGAVVFVLRDEAPSGTLTLSEFNGACVAEIPTDRCSTGANLSAPPPGFAGFAGLGVLDPNSPLVKASITALDLPNIPTTLLADNELQCRDLEFPEPGADEVIEAAGD